uniref:Uncharacterized protein n=1 Tax=Anguilla anguilla TaxID=7936 RepID=A0A0E9Y1G7_ANGAN
MQTLCQIKVLNISYCLMEHIEIHVENCWSVTTGSIFLQKTYVYTCF